MSTSLPPSIPSQDELEKICELEKKIVTQGEHSKKVLEKKIKSRGLETEMKKNKAEQDEKIQTLEETVTAQRETIEKQNIKISELEEKDRKIIELEQKFQSLSQYVNPAISSIISQLEDLS